MKVVAFYHSLNMKIRDEMRAHSCFEYLQDMTKHVDAAAMAVLLQQLGLSQPHELQYVDDAQLCDIVVLFKPVAAKVFVHMMGLVKRGW